MSKIPSNQRDRDRLRGDREYYLLGRHVPKGVLVEANHTWPELFTPRGTLTEDGEMERCRLLDLAQPLLLAIYTWRTRTAGTDYDDRVIAHDYVHAILKVDTSYEEEDFVAEVQEFWGIETISDALAWRDLNHPVRCE